MLCAGESSGKRRKGAVTTSLAAAGKMRAYGQPARMLVTFCFLIIVSIWNRPRHAQVYILNQPLAAVTFAVYLSITSEFIEVQSSSCVSDMSRIAAAILGQMWNIEIRRGTASAIAWRKHEDVQCDSHLWVSSVPVVRESALSLINVSKITRQCIIIPTP
jgi:hypothetical protein